MEQSYERFLGFADIYDEGRPSLNWVNRNSKNKIKINSNKILKL